jgi:biotin operon repressor
LHLAPTREDDERALRILDLRKRGYSQPEIAAKVGMTRNQVASCIQKVREQDCKHDPDHAPKYWRIHS